MLTKKTKIPEIFQSVLQGFKQGQLNRKFEISYTLSFHSKLKGGPQSSN
jgi:hypothetical protein